MPVGDTWQAAADFAVVCLPRQRRLLFGFVKTFSGVTVPCTMPK